MKSQKSIFILFSSVVIFALGFSATSVLGFENIARFFHMPLAMKPDATIPYVPGVEGCDQSATSTPCSEIEARAKMYVQPSTSEASGRKFPDGPLVNTYSDQKYGFSIKYPDGYQINQASGDATNRILLKDSASLQQNSQKGFVLSIKHVSDLSPSQRLPSIDAYMVPRTVSPIGGYVSKVIPTKNITVTLSNGVRMLEQTYDQRVYDDSGNDITQKICEECSKNARQYVIFKNSNAYLLVGTGKFNDEQIEKNIINSIIF